MDEPEENRWARVRIKRTNANGITQSHDGEPTWPLAGTKSMLVGEAEGGVKKGARRKKESERLSKMGSNSPSSSTRSPSRTRRQV